MALPAFDIVYTRRCRVYLRCVFVVCLERVTFTAFACLRCYRCRLRLGTHFCCASFYVYLPFTVAHTRLRLRLFTLHLHVCARRRLRFD